MDQPWKQAPTPESQHFCDVEHAGGHRLRDFTSEPRKMPQVEPAATSNPVWSIHVHPPRADEGRPLMYPVLFRVGSVEITSFGVLVGLAALVALWLFRRELRRTGGPLDATDAAIYGIVAGLIGAKALWVAEHFGEAPLSSLILSRAGLSWFGGLVAGFGTGLWMIHRRHWSALSILAAATPALAIGHAIGRVGCFLVGDDYGRPSGLAWAVAFPEGAPPTTVPVHPTQIYEAAALIPIAALLLRQRRYGTSDARVLGSYLILTSMLRFFIEFVRINERVALGLTVAQWVALCLAVAGVVLVIRSVRRPAILRTR